MKCAFAAATLLLFVALAAAVCTPSDVDWKGYQSENLDTHQKSFITFVSAGVVQPPFDSPNQVPTEYAAPANSHTYGAAMRSASGSTYVQFGAVVATNATGGASLASHVVVQFLNATTGDYVTASEGPLPSKYVFLEMSLCCTGGAGLVQYSWTWNFPAAMNGDRDLCPIVYYGQKLCAGVDNHIPCGDSSECRTACTMASPLPDSNEVYCNPSWQ